MMKPISIILILSLLCAACGDDSASSSGAVTHNTAPDVGTDLRDSTDAHPDLPVPRFLEIEMDPGRQVYATGQKLVPIVGVFDVYAEPIPEALYDVTVAPADAAVLVGDRWDLKKQGVVTFTACALLDGPEGEPVCGSDTLVVDDAPPMLTVTSPLAGQQLDDADLPVQVAGTVSDDHGQPLVYVNGVEVEVVNGEFSTTVAPRFGINHIEVTATDQVNPQSTTAGVDYLYAPQYFAQLRDKPGVQLEDAIVFWLGENFVDDLAQVSRGQDGTLVTHDLVDILELVLRYVDLMAQIPDPVLDSSGAFLQVTGIDIGKPHIEGSIVDGGIELYVQIQDLRVTTHGGLDVNSQILNLDGDVTATMSALVRLNITKSGDNPVEVTVGTLELAVEDATANFASPEANAIFTLAQSALRATLEQLLLDAVRDAFIDQLPTLLSGILNSLDSALQNQSFNLDLGLGTPLTLELDARMTRLQTLRRSKLEAGLSGTTSIDVTGIHTQSRGIPSMTTSSAPFFSSSRIQIGLQQVFLNGLLHGLWDAGMLELDVTEQVPITAQKVTISAKIQPVLRPPLEGQDATLVLQLGQLELEVELLGRSDRYGVNIETGAVFDLVDSDLSVTFSNEPDVVTWVISSSDDAALLTPDALKQLILTNVYPQLLAALSDGLSFALPAPDVSGIGSVSPALASFSLTFGLAHPIVLREGWVVVDATLDGTL